MATEAVVVVVVVVVERMLRKGLTDGVRQEPSHALIIRQKMVTEAGRMK